MLGNTWVRLRKELRELAVPWAQGMAVCLLATAMWPRAAYHLSALLAFYLASRTFGAEFDHGTLPRLLAQPIPRWRIWGEKMLAAALAIAAGYALVFLTAKLTSSEPIAPSGWHFVGLLGALATATAVSLWLRDSLRSFWASLCLVIVYQVATAVVWHYTHPFLTRFFSDFVLVLLMWSFYCAALLILGYIQLSRLEVTSGPAGSGRRRAASRQEKERRNRGLVLELVLKEVRLQVAGLWLVAVAVAGWLVAWVLAARPDVPIAAAGTLGEVLQAARFLPSAALLLVVPVLLGANAVAWERQLGVLGWQLVQPVSHRFQWRLKIAVCLVLTLLVALLGVGLTWLLARQLSMDGLVAALPQLAQLPLFALAFGLYGSKIGKTPFQALGLGLVFGIAVLCVWSLVGFSAAVAGYGLYGQEMARGPQWLLGGSPVALSVYLLLFALIWASPSLADWLAGRRLVRSAGLAALLALVLGALVLQIYSLDRSSRALARESAALEAEIESLGGIASLDWLAEELGLDDERLHVDQLGHVIDFGTFFYAQESSEEHRSYHQPLSRSMRLVSCVDGVDLTEDNVDRWYWSRRWRERKFRDGDEVLPYWRPVPRNIRSPWRRLSVAPYWFQGHRRQQLDRRVRQNVVLEAAQLGRSLRRRMALEPDRFRELLDVGFAARSAKFRRARKNGKSQSHTANTYAQ